MKFNFSVEPNGRNLKINVDGKPANKMFEKLRLKMSVRNKGARFYRWAPERIHSITPTGVFRPGLYAEVIQTLKQLDSDIEIEFDKEVYKIINPLNVDEFKYFTSDEMVPRDYQAECIAKGMQRGRGIFEVATAGGKSFIIYNMIMNIREKGFGKCLVLVPSLQLVTQMHDDFIDYGIDPSLVQMFSSFDSELTDAPIVVANRDWLRKYSNKEIFELKTKLEQARIIVKKLSKNKKAPISKKAQELFKLKEKDLKDGAKLLKRFTNRLVEIPERIEHIKETIPVIEAFECLFVDEVHGLSAGNNVSKFVENMKTNLRFGFTGTLQTKKEDAESRWGIIGMIGPVLYTKRAHELQAQDFIAKLKIIPIEMVHIKPVPYTIDDNNFKHAHRIEQEFVEGLPEYNNLIVTLARKAEGNTFVLFDHTKHGHLLHDMCTAQIPNKKVMFINGAIPIEERDKIKQYMIDNEDCVLVGNVKCVGTGLSIKNIRNIVFAINGKAQAKIIQAIGRAVRLHKNKTCARLYDIFHSLKYSTKHFSARCGLYKEHYKITVDDSDIKKFEI